MFVENYKRKKEGIDSSLDVNDIGESENNSS